MAKDTGNTDYLFFLAMLFFVWVVYQTKEDHAQIDAAVEARYERFGDCIIAAVEGGRDMDDIKARVRLCAPEKTKTPDGAPAVKGL